MGEPMPSASFLVLLGAVSSSATPREPLLPNRRSKLCPVRFVLGGLPNRPRSVPGITGTVAPVAKVVTSNAATSPGGTPFKKGAHRDSRKAALAKSSTAKQGTLPSPTRSCQIFWAHLASSRYQAEFVREKLQLTGNDGAAISFDRRLKAKPDTDCGTQKH